MDDQKNTGSRHLERVERLTGAARRSVGIEPKLGIESSTSGRSTEITCIYVIPVVPATRGCGLNG